MDKICVYVKDIFLLQSIKMAQIAPVLFKGYGILRRTAPKVSVSASPSLCIMCIGFVSITWTNVTLSATAQAC